MVKHGPKGPSKYTDEFIKKEAKALLEYMNTAPIPFLKEFAWKRGYPSQYITDVFTRNELFSESLKRMKDIQEVKIVLAAMTKKIDVTMAIFTLKNVAGWRDTPVVELDKELIDSTLNFHSVPKNGNGKDRLKQYFN